MNKFVLGFYDMSFFNSIFNILRFNKKNWHAVVLCIIAATVFWFFNALNKNYTTSISFPLAFDYDREHYVSIRPLPGSVRINVTGIGWNLFRRSAGLKVPPLVIPLERPADVKKIVGSTMPAFFANQLADFQINFVITDTLHVAIEPKKKRTLGLTVDVPAPFFKGDYGRVSEIRITPDSISLEGPLALINELPDPLRIQIPQRNIDEDFDEVLDVRFLNDELIQRDPQTVKVEFQVEELRNISDSVQLEVIHAPEQAKAIIERKKLAYAIAIPLSGSGNFQPDSVKAVIDLSGFSKGEKKVLPVLKGIPPYTKVIKFDSVSIKY